MESVPLLDVNDIFSDTKERFLLNIKFLQSSISFLFAEIHLLLFTHYCLPGLNELFLFLISGGH